MAVVSFIAWRAGRAGFGLWHETRDNRYTVCGKRPGPLVSVWRGTKPPSVEDVCRTCRNREAQEMRNR